MKHTALLLAVSFVAFATPMKAAPPSNALTKIPVVFSEGHETEGVDRGRPVILIAAALGVTSEVFRDAFSGVRPAKGGGPSDAEARANKKVLMDALGKHGVTDQRLNEVSNYYRYRRENGEIWTSKPAVANALVQNGVVTGYEVIEGGAGYSSPPVVTVPGVTGTAAKVELQFGRKLETNGSVSAITVGDKAR